MHVPLFEGKLHLTPEQQAIVQANLTGKTRVLKVHSITSLSLSSSSLLFTITITITIAITITIIIITVTVIISYHHHQTAIRLSRMQAVARRPPSPPMHVRGLRLAFCV
jgi:heme/copper-type cytochrome/quinol oxidase subunit 2